MKNSKKKFLSLFLTAVMLTGMLNLIFPVYAVGDVSITFNTNGGMLKDGVKTEYNSGDVLPGYENIGREGFIFAGWYDNAEFAGTPLYSVPSGTVGSKSYYAKWIIQNTLYYDGFEKDKGLYDWSSGTTLSVNTDKENVYSGEKSIKYEIPANAAGNLAQTDGTMIEGDGVYFWIKTERATTLYLQFKKSSSIVSSDITVPAGKSIVAVPWTDIKNIASQGEWAGAIQIMIKSSDISNTVYIDNIATYNSCNAISFQLNGGKFLNDAPFDYSPGMVLPTYEDITRKGYMFAGWYDNENLSGDTVYFIPSDAAGSKTYYAKWVLNEINGDDFESYKDTAAVSVDNNGYLVNKTDMIDNDKGCYYWSGITAAKARLNKDKKHTYSGKKSVELYLPKKDDTVANWRNYTHFAIPNHSVDGDGAYFWLESDNAVIIRVMFQYQKAATAKFTVPAGRHLVTVPWSSVTGDIWGKQMLIEFTHSAEDTTIYLDDFGTYENTGSNGDNSESGIEFNLCGGSFKNYTAPTEYVPKMQLPTYENVVMDGHMFAGWYDNAGFEGLPTFFVPANASGNKVYYARWVDCNPSFDDFESYIGKETQDAVNFWASWTYSGELSLNTNAENAYNGTKSMKVLIKNRSIHGDDRADLVLDKDIHRDGNGIYFWIKTEIATQVWLRFNYSKSSQGFTTAKVSIPAGKNLVMIPWKEIPEADVRNLWWLVEVNVATPALAGIENTVYIDDIGTFTDYVENAISFDLNGGAFADGYTAPLGYNSNSEFILPTYKNVVNDGLTFAGWYDNSKLSGKPVTTIGAGETGSKTYYAKWVIRDVSFDNFETGLGDWQNWAEGSSKLSNETTLFQSGKKSMRYEITKDLTWDTSLYIKKDMPIVGDGVCFTIKAEQSSTISLKFNHLTNLVTLEPINLTKGENHVFISWSEFGDKLSGRNKLTEMQIVLGRTKGYVYYIDDIGTYTENTAVSKDITYKTNGGVWTESYTAPVKYANGSVFLPSDSCIVRKGYIFMGWYDNADCTGNPIQTVPFGSADNKTYYARWIKPKTLYDGFESGLGKGGSAWQDWTGSANMSIDTEAENINSGNNSMKYVIPGKDSYIYVTERSLSVDGNGICFWISTEKAATLKLQLDHYNPTTLKSKEINVPTGKSFVTVPWSDITKTSKKALKSLEFQIKTADAGNTYYIDDIGTYTENEKYTITYNITGSEWIGAYTPETEYSDAGCDLPGYEKIKNTSDSNMSFVGWCEKQDLSDKPILTIPAGTVGNKVFYPKWAVHVADYDNFDSYKNTAALKNIWKNENTNTSEMELNSIAADIHYGSKSIKLTVKKLASQNETTKIVNKTVSIAKTGNGICLWIKAEKATSIGLRLNYETSSKPGITTLKKYVPAGKSYITFSWAELGVQSIKRLDIMLAVPSDSGTNTVYVDSIGTHHDSLNLNIGYNLDGGNFVNESSAAQASSLLESTVLPTFENVKKDGFYFAGWYESKEYVGNPIYVLAPGASGKKLWAKWVEQDNCNHTFDDFSNTQAMLDAEWSDYRGFEGWRENGGTTLTLNTNTANTASDSKKSLQISYRVPDGEYIAGGEAPASLFKNYSWSTTFGTRSTSKEGDGIRFWIKSDRTITFSVVFSMGWLKFSYMPKVTVPANTPVTVYLPWSTLNNGGIEAYNLYEAGFEIYDNVGAEGKVWIDDLGIYYNEKIVDFVRFNDDGDIKITGYNNHIPKNTVVEITKRPFGYLQEIGGKIPTDAEIKYLADYKLLSPAGGTADLSGPAWISFKLPAGVDVNKLGMYEVFFDGSRAALNYTIEGDWITVYTLNPTATLMMTANDNEWAPRGPSTENGIVQPLKVTETITETTETDNEPQTDQNDRNDSDEQSTDDNAQNNTENNNPTKRRSKRKPINRTNAEEETDVPWASIIIIGASVLVVIAAGITLIIVTKRRRSKRAGGAK